MRILKQKITGHKITEAHLRIVKPPIKLVKLMRVPNSVKIDKEGFYLGRTLISYVSAVEGNTKKTLR